MSDLGLGDLIDKSIKGYADQGIVLAPDTKEQVVAYLTKVYKQYLKDQGVSKDVIESVLSERKIKA